LKLDVISFISLAHSSVLGIEIRKYIRVWNGQRVVLLLAFINKYELSEEEETEP
jgi:hypothetical protein